MTQQIVLLHAFPVRSELWAAQKNALEAAGFTVHTPDFRGFGANQPVELPTPESLDVLVEDVREHLDSQGLDRVILGGLSLGGYVTLAFLAKYPQRLAGIVLANTRATADTSDGAAGRLAFAERVENEGSGWVAQQVIPQLLAPAAFADRGDLVELLTSWIASADPAAIAWAQRAMAARVDTTAALADFVGPVLVIAGEHDALASREAVAAMVEAARDVEFVTIAGAGHMSAIEAPNEVSDSIIGWLRRQA